MIGTRFELYNPSMGGFAGLPGLCDTALCRAAEGTKSRNSALDRLFYDVDNLTEDEFAWLLAETNHEGSILIVWPSGAKADTGVKKFADHASLCAAPGALLKRFAIAGVGSSDVGAAAFARTVADRYQEPVGAIVAGYGAADLLAEALGGWFVMGAANRFMKAYQDALRATDELSQPMPLETAEASAEGTGGSAEINVCQTDSDTLLRLLREQDRTIASVAGHSKGSLSIAYALGTLSLTSDRTAIERAQKMRITTVGAVVALPTGYENAGQYLGAIDWFGGMNSQREIQHELVAGAWHHLNTSIPMHMDFAAVLAQEPD